MRFECRRPVSISVLAVLAVCPAGTLAEQRVRERVDVILTTAPMLSESARASMMAEATAIWQHHGIDLEWLPATVVRPVASNRLRVLVVPKRPVTSETGRIAVGELVRPADGHPVALISIESAQRLVSSVPGRAGHELGTIAQQRLGTVLGRALAHEIGHYLLDTHTHARSGLMRPYFNALEFTDLRDGVFALDHAAEAWLRTRDVDRFAY